MKIKIFAAAISLCLSPCGYSQEKIDGKFVSEVVCEGPVSIRYEKSPTFSIIGDPGPYREMILEVISELNAIWTGLPVQIVVVADNDKKADITFTMKKSDIRESGNVRYKFQNRALSSSTITWEWTNQLGPDTSTKRLAYHQILQAMGFRYLDKNISKDSIWSVSSYIGEQLPTTPTEIDKQAIRFKYEIPSGTEKWKIRELAKKALK